MKLKKITLKGFKSFKELELELGNLNILIGPNGAGKSNFLSFFELVNEIIEKRLQVYIGTLGGADFLLHYGKKTTEEIDFELKFGENTYLAKLIPSQKDSLIFKMEDFNHLSPDVNYYPGTGAITESRLELDADRPQFAISIIKGVINYFKSFKIYHFHDTSRFAKMRQKCEINDNKMLRHDASNLAAFLYFLKEIHFQHYKNIVDTLKRVAPFFDDFILMPDKLNINRINLEWRERDSDSYFDARYLSDGSLRFICLATLLLQPELPPIILLDEPELGLHPSAITILANLIKSASQKTQIICATESVTFVNKFEPRNILVVDRKNGESNCRRFSPEELGQWLDDYELGDLWEKNVIGGNP